MRLAKLIAERGVASRRAAEELIRQDAVTVNGRVARVTTPVDPDRDIVVVRGTRLPEEPAKAYYLLNKPAGYITTRSDPQGRKSVLELIAGLPVRVEPVGRLDYDTEGALLFTNDGQMAHHLTHPSRRVPKQYLARVQGVPSKETLSAMERGVTLEDGVTAPAKARIARRLGAFAWADITITEGRNRLIRRMLLKLGHPVMELRRVSFAGISIRGLGRGEVRELTEAEVRRLQAAVEVRAEPRPAERATR